MRQLPTEIGELAYILHGRSFAGPNRVTAGTVTKITRTGQITVEENGKIRRFTNHGWEMAGGYRGAQLIDKETYDRFVVESDVAALRSELYTLLDGLIRTRFRSKTETLRVLAKALDTAANGLPTDGEG